MLSSRCSTSVLTLTCAVFLVTDAPPTLGQCELQKLTASDPAANDRFGWWVSISGDRAIVGVPWDDDASPDDPQCDSGSAYIYRRKGPTWVEEAKLTADNCVGGEIFGNPVAISGDVAALGAHEGDPTGSVYMFRWNGTTWVEEQKLLPSDGAPGDQFGESVSLCGEVIAIGAPWKRCEAGLSCGSAYVFRYDGARWVEEAELTSPDPAPQDQFGNSIALDDGRIIVGVWKDDDAGYNSGSAYVFRRDVASWVAEGKLTASDGATNNSFGASVSIGGTAIVVGAPLTLESCADGSACRTGSAYIFRREGTNWIEEAKLIAWDPAGGEWFGYSVVISGDTTVVGAPGHFASRGSVYVFKRDGTGWVAPAWLAASDAAPGDSFGKRVSLSQEYVVVGAPGRDDAATTSGAAYVYRVLGVPDGNFNGINDACEPDCNDNGITDDLDIAAGTSDDCNENGVPDECEDCNENGVADSCDIADGTSQDCTGNGVPDECEPDCNGNSVADSCDIAGDTSEDCTGNGLPDECEPDCNENSVADSCDIADRTSDDCNGSGVPDECEIADGTSDDCNDNGVPDKCEEDCNKNGAPDDCDITDGTSQDVDENGIPDECENWSLCVTGEGYFDYSPHRSNREAEYLAMDLSGQLRAPDDEYNRILRDLQLIRDAYPYLADVVDRSPDYAPDHLLVRLFPDLPHPNYDALNTFYQVIDDHEYHYIEGLHLLTFCDNLNTPLLAPEYIALPEVQNAEPGWIGGYSNEITVTPLGTAYRYRIVNGFGDCPAGCTCLLIWVFDVDESGNVVLISYEGPLDSCGLTLAPCCFSGASCVELGVTPCMNQGGIPLRAGTACEGDLDGDGLDAVCGDNCPDTPNPGQEDCNNDGEGDACDPDPGEAYSPLCGDGILNHVCEECDGPDGVPDPCEHGCTTICTCVPLLVPMLPKWGLVGLGLLLLAGGAMVFGRRRVFAPDSE